MLCFRGLENAKIQAIYFEIYGLYFKICALYFLRQAMYFWGEFVILHSARLANRKITSVVAGMWHVSPVMNKVALACKDLH